MYYLIGLIMKELQKLLSKLRQGVDHYSMIGDGDKIAVGVSGGKDSVALLYGLVKLKEFYPKKFDVCAVSIDLGFNKSANMFADTAQFADSHNIEYKIINSQIADIVFTERKEKNPCALCAKLRRGALVDSAKSFGANKLALGHHLDDVVETFMLSLMYEGRIGCFSPITVYDDNEISVIRPMIYATEYEVKTLAKAAKLPITQNPCPNDGESRREEMKNYLRSFDKDHRGLYKRILGALERGEIDGWHI